MMYRAYGRWLDSDKRLPELEAPSRAKALRYESDAAPADFRVVWDAVVRPPLDARWTTLWRFSDGEPWVTVARTANARWLRFGRFADFRISPGLIEIAPRGRVTDATLRHLLLDQALPLACAAEGALVLHASAVQIGNAAVLMVGVGGAGKSTMAAMLARDGCPVLADDGVRLEEGPGGLHAVPSYPGLRLYPDSFAAAHIDGGPGEVAEDTRKRRIVCDPMTRSPDDPVTQDAALFRAVSAPLGRVYALATTPGPPAFEPLSHRDATMELMRHVYRIDIDERSEMQAQLDLIVHWSKRIDIWRLSYPRDLSKAAGVARALAAHARLGDGHGGQASPDRPITRWPADAPRD